MWLCEGRRNVAVRRVLRAGWIFVVLLCTGCGFHLQGAEPLPAEVATTFIATDQPFSPFYRLLTRELRTRQVNVVPNAASGAATLRILRDETGQRVLSVSARNVPREYEVYYIIEFSLEADGRTLIDRQRLVRSRNYTWDETEVLGKLAEEETLREALARDLVTQVLGWVSSSGS